MDQLTISCPKCGAEIPLTETLAGPMLAQVRQEMQAKVDEAKDAARTAKMDADIARADIERDIKFKVDEEVNRVRASIAAEVSGEITELRVKLGEAQQVQAAAVKKERELDDAKRELDLTIERRVTEALASIRQAARAESDEANKLKLAEAETTIRSMQTKLAEAQQKAEQGSQQLQGEVQEMDLKARLADRFRDDVVSDVAKGVVGADLVQAVVGEAGLILWESKRTKSWSAGWLAKLREDGRAAKADVLVLVTQTLPKEVESFDCLDGVWVCSPRYALSLAAVLREALLRAAAERVAQAGTETKSVVVYRYMTGPRFRQRVEAVVEAFTTMREDLDAERRAFTKAWAKRETQLERALTGAAGLFGDLQALSGPGELPEITGLGMRALEDGR